MFTFCGSLECVVCTIAFVCCFFLLRCCVLLVRLRVVVVCVFALMCYCWRWCSLMVAQSIVLFVRMGLINYVCIVVFFFLFKCLFR